MQYLKVILDLFNREVVDKSISSTLSTETTVVAALKVAVLYCQPLYEA
ncbi:hypothetical protein OO006_02900 [Prosthecochloris sp. SCSIO W1101]|nr:hypothetical protein [Prosthecochloris sp. SCSIO W1101]UZJ41962.1 hypothetical protein OO006_02900 [Prosthecochloris sp. SCSIO W1101]